MEVLAGELARLMRADPGDPFAPERIVVPHPAIGRWLSLELARVLGIAANVRFELPAAFAWSIMREALPDLPGESAYAPARLRWRIHDVLPELAEEAEGRAVRGYLGDGDPRKRFELADRLARVFDRCLLYRSGWIREWERGAVPHWQARLWRRLAGDGRWAGEEHSTEEEKPSGEGGSVAGERAAGEGRATGAGRAAGEGWPVGGRQQAAGAGRAAGEGWPVGEGQQAAGEGRAAGEGWPAGEGQQAAGEGWAAGEEWPVGERQQAAGERREAPADHWAAAIDAFHTRLAAGARPSSWPRRAVFFGVSSLSPSYLEMLRRAAERIEIHLFMLVPCREYWGDIRSKREIHRRAGGEDPGAGYFTEGNELLAAWGRAGRDTFDALVEGESVEWEDHFVPPEDACRLAAVQRDILDLRLASEAAQIEAAAPPEDVPSQGPAADPPAGTSSERTSSADVPDGPPTAHVPPAGLPGETTPAHVPPASRPVEATPAHVPPADRPVEATPAHIPSTGLPVEATPAHVPPASLPGEATPIHVPSAGLPGEATPTHVPSADLPGEATPAHVPSADLPGEATPAHVPSANLPGEATPAHAPPDGLPVEATPAHVPPASLPGEATPAHVLPARAQEGGQGRWPPSDDSLQIHVCHSPLREAEVLHDRLLAIFDTHPDLEPADVLVLTPDLAVYGPAVEAVFGAAGRIPCNVMRARGGESRTLRAFLDLLDLPGSRLGAEAVLAPLDAPAVRARFGIGEGDLPALRGLVREAGIRWGADQAHRGAEGLPETAGHTWRQGLRRLLLGYAMPDADILVEGLVPCPAGADGFGAREVDAELLGRFVSYCEEVIGLGARLAGERRPAQWAGVLRGVVNGFLASGPGPARGAVGEAGNRRFAREPASEVDAVHALVRDFGREAGHGESPVPFALVRDVLRERVRDVSGEPARLADGVTVAGLTPGRVFPAAVVCIAGMNDGAFPRIPSFPSFDLMAAGPARRGDRDIRHEDRFAFLEALLAARRCFLVSYTGRGLRDDAPIPPSVLVDELKDYLARRFPGAIIKTRHPLQPFSPRYFLSGALRTPGGVASSAGEAADPPADGAAEGGGGAAEGGSGAARRGGGAAEGSGDAAEGGGGAAEGGGGAAEGGGEATKGGGGVAEGGGGAAERGGDAAEGGGGAVGGGGGVAEGGGDAAEGGGGAVGGGGGVAERGGDAAEGGGGAAGGGDGTAESRRGTAGGAPGEALFSYSHGMCEAARAMLAGEQAPTRPGRFARPLPEPDESQRVVDPADLISFFANPARFFLRHRLGARLEVDDATLDEEEPFELDGLERYRLRSEVWSRMRAGSASERTEALLSGRGRLPQAGLGRVVHEREWEEAEQLEKQLAPHRAALDAPSREVDFEIGGFRIVGALERIGPDGTMVWPRIGRLRARDRIEIWLRLLAWAAAGNGPAQAVGISREGSGKQASWKSERFPAPERADEQLERWLRVWWRGLAAPLPFFPETSYAYAHGIARPGRHAGAAVQEAAWDKARDKWFGNDRQPGERDDPYLRLVHDGDPPLIPEFEDLAVELLVPLIAPPADGPAPAAGARR